VNLNWLLPPIGTKAPPQEILLPVKTRYIAVTLLMALVLDLLALPGVLQQIRPDFIALTLIYWVVYHPRRVGFLPAWTLGLIMDVRTAACLVSTLWRTPYSCTWLSCCTGAS
jgi:cell shape-determining protein MreD